MLATFSRYLGVQIFAYAIDFGTFFLISSVAGGNPLYANVAGKILAGAFAFFAHRKVTFRLQGARGSNEQALRYVILLALNTPLATLILSLLMRVIEYPVVAKVISDAICIGLTFLISKHLVFVSRQRGKDDA